MADAATLRSHNTAFWTGAAAGWIRHADRQDEIGRPLGAPAMERMAARPAEHILDVGCGCGGTTAELAAAVGETGAAVGIDIAEAMVTAARQRFPRTGTRVSGSTRQTSRPSMSCRGHRSTRRTREWP